MLAEESTRLDLHAGDSRSDGAVDPGDRSRYSLILLTQYDRQVSQGSTSSDDDMVCGLITSVGATFRHLNGH